MRLVDLKPEWLGHGGENYTDVDGNPIPRREAVALNFACPCGCAVDITIAIENPLDGGGPPGKMRPLWHRTGETFDTLTLTPSILRLRHRTGETFDTLTLTPSILRLRPEDYGCKGWHGFITNGEIITC